MRDNCTSRPVNGAQIKIKPLTGVQYAPPPHENSPKLAAEERIRQVEIKMRLSFINIAAVAAV
jgi:hypothetical protein